MKKYYITTYTEEGAMTCNYDYSQWIELIKSFKQSGIEFEAYTSNF